MVEYIVIRESDKPIPKEFEELGVSGRYHYVKQINALDEHFDYFVTLRSLGHLEAIKAFAGCDVKLTTAYIDNPAIMICDLNVKELDCKFF